jgi:hypothetical protein
VSPPGWRGLSGRDELAVRDLDDVVDGELSRLHDVPIADLAPVYGIQAHSLRRRRLRAEAAIAATVA